MDVDDSHASTQTQEVPSYAPNVTFDGESPGYSTSNDLHSKSMDVTASDGDAGSHNDSALPADENMAVSAEDQVLQEDIHRQRLANARQALQQPDAVLENDVFTNIKTIFESGGSPQEIIRSLAGSYHGFPQMCNLVSFWLRRLGVPDSEIVSSVEGHIRAEIKKSFDPHKADRIFEMGSVRAQTFAFLYFFVSESLLQCASERLLTLHTMTFLFRPSPYLFLRLQPGYPK